MIENDTGALRVMASGLEFGDDIEAGERPYDLVTKGRRQAGSAFKPMALVAALEHGSQDGLDITLGSFWDSSSPQEIDCGQPCGGRGSDPNIWTVRNAESGGGSGIRTLEEATYRSTNTVYAQLSVAVGPENIVETSHRMGIESPLNPVLSIPLGTQTVSPYEMAAAYSTIANYGDKVEPYLIERIEDADGKVVYQHEVKREQVLDRPMTAAVVRTLEKVVTQGTATRAAIGRPAAGKTGTAQDYRDVWFVGFIPQFTTAVWSGYPDAAIALEGFTVFNEASGQPQYYDRAFGGTLTAPIWQQFMSYITEDLPVRDFLDEPSGTDDWFEVPETTVPDVSGLSSSEAKASILRAGLFANIVATPSSAPEGTFLGQSPTPGTTVDQGSSVSVRYSSGVPPAVPNLVGLDLGEAQGVIDGYNSASGMDLSIVTQPQPTENEAMWDVVISTNPPPGAAVSQGAVVTVIYGVPPEDPPDPPDDDPPGNDPPDDPPDPPGNGRRGGDNR
jgi:membrane peptidoglycan carboxypeptidase